MTDAAESARNVVRARIHSHDRAANCWLVVSEAIEAVLEVVTSRQPFFWNQQQLRPGARRRAVVGAFAKVVSRRRCAPKHDRRKSAPIEPALRSLIAVRVSPVNACSFCVDLNSATLLERGASLAKVGALSDWRASDLFDDREQIALEYAEAMTRSDRQVGDDVLAGLRRHFDHDAIVELTGLIAFQNLSSKFNSAFAVPAQGFCPLPPPGMDSDR